MSFGHTKKTPKFSKNIPGKKAPLDKGIDKTEKPKERKCRCGNTWIKQAPLQSKCIDCTIKKAKSDREKKERQEKREAKEKIKKKSDHMSELQEVVNLYVRLRDWGKPCISCDKPHDGSHQRHASHYRSVGACSSLRFNLWNIHASCMQCNSHKAGNVVEYRIRLIEKIGTDKVEFLESHNMIVNYDIDYLIRMKAIFRKRCRIMKKRIKERSEYGF